MKKYEAIFILDERETEDGGEAFSAAIEKTIGSLGGRLVEAKSLGRKTFAREIKKRQGGIYWGFVLELPPGAVAEFQDRYRLDRNVLRLQVVNYEAPPPQPAEAPVAQP